MYFLPVLKTFLVVILAVYWIAVSANLASSGTLTSVGLNATHPDGYPVPGVGKVVEMEMSYQRSRYEHVLLSLFWVFVDNAVVNCAHAFYDREFSSSVVFCPACQWQKRAE